MYVDDDSWAGNLFSECTKPTKNAPHKHNKTIPFVESSFMLALQYKRYRLMDEIFKR